MTREQMDLTIRINALLKAYTVALERKRECEAKYDTLYELRDALWSEYNISKETGNHEDIRNAYEACVDCNKELREIGEEYVKVLKDVNDIARRIADHLLRMKNLRGRSDV